MRNSITYYGIHSGLKQADIKIDDVRKNYTFVKRAQKSGYLSRNGNPMVLPYRGVYGEGYIIAYPNYRSTRYVMIEYWVDKRWTL